MRATFALAVKDWRILLRQPGALFFVIAWPILTAVMFGLIFGGGGATAKPRIAIVDRDATPDSERFVAQVRALDTIETDVHPEPAARELVRTGKRVAVVIVPEGYGEASARLFAGDPPRVIVLVDPSRKAERAMLEGYLQQVAGQGLSERLLDPELGKASVAQARTTVGDLPAAQRLALEAMFDSLDGVFDAGVKPESSSTIDGAWTPLDVEVEEITATRGRPRNGFAVTFPQGLLWGIVGCLMTFASALVLERQQGTLARLRASPLGAREILAGKAIACAGAIAAVALVLFAMAALVFGVRPGSWGLLALAVVVAAFCFTGVMMLVASVGTTVESVSGAGWAVMMPLMMFGGGMIPLFAMPGWMAKASHFSPVKWATLAFEGAIWRNFTLAEMALPLGILAAVGIVGFVLGTRSFARNL